MLMDLKTFGHRVSFDREALIQELSTTTRRSTPAEIASWRSSLPTLWAALNQDSLRDFHLHLGNRGDIAVEYRLPALSFWADAILLGRGPRGPAAVVIELKDWKTTGDRPGPRAALIERPLGTTMHPSDQVQGYVEFCQRFHSAVLEAQAEVAGCVYFTLASQVDAYRAEPHQELTRAFPIFAQNESDVTEALPAFIRKHLQTPDADFARKFELGVYKQDRTLVRQVAVAIQQPSTSPFVLVDKQREGFELCMAAIDRHLKPARKSARTSTGKTVVVIEGPPGSGKSIIAAHLWASLAADDRIAGNVVLTTTSTAQRRNWQTLFANALGDSVARGMVIGANSYNPGINQQWLAAERSAGRTVTAQTWRANCKRHRSQSQKLKCEDDSFAISIVDEAHALIDPTVEGRQGMSASGWMLHAGPQAWHVIRASKVSIFLLDPAQSYRDNETTTIESIKAFALDQDAHFCHINLGDSQFRCSGSVEYMQWVDGTLELGAKASLAQLQKLAPRWRKNFGGPFEVDVFDDPQALEDALRERIAGGKSARLAASYARPWLTKGVSNPHRAPTAKQDFQIPYMHDGSPRTWTRIWNYTPDADYSVFIQAPQGSDIQRDPLAEVGCPYVLRGFDFHYIGLLWLKDLVWRGDRWQVNLDQVHESAWRLPLSRARHGDADNVEEVITRLRRGYRILLSRAMLGTMIWFEDPETREHVEQLLGNR
jgi:hypothetical protein